MRDRRECLLDIEFAYDCSPLDTMSASADRRYGGGLAIGLQTTSRRDEQYDTTFTDHHCHSERMWLSPVSASNASHPEGGPYNDRK